MAVETTTSTATTQIDPAIQPYLSYALGEAQRLYQNAPAAVGPSADTQRAMEAMRQRAMAGSPLVGSAQGELAANIGGQYLSGNPFFQGAFAPAAEAAQLAFNKGVGDISSAASKAGRYGTNAAVTNLYGGNANTFAKALTGTAGQLAYQNYADERARQMAAVGAAPTFAAQDYADAGRLLNIGQLGEQYQTSANALPQQNLTNYLTAVYGQPMGKTTTQQTPYFTNPTATALGTGLLGLQFANAAAPWANKATNWLGSKWDSWTANPAVANAPDNIDIGGGFNPADVGSGEWWLD